MDLKLIKCLDLYMDTNHLTEIGAPEAAEVLDREGLLKNSKHGFPLRKKLRDGKFEQYAYQIGSTWHIKRSDIPWPTTKKIESPCSSMMNLQKLDSPASRQ